jgi:competence protein ComEA
MKLNIESLRSWFGFTRRERRSSFMLLLIIIMIITLRFIIPEKNIAIIDVTNSFSGLALSSGFSEEVTKPIGQPFLFDPNTVSFDSLVQLGLSSKEANTLISYRKKGGKFFSPSDIKKIYGIDETLALRLLPYVKVEKFARVPVRSETANQRQQQIKLDINNCDSASLDRLPGIGPVLSARIIKYRYLIGGFARIDQLKEVYGLSGETFDLIKGRIFADSSALIRININTATYNELTRLPYFEKYEVTAILKYRELKGKISGNADLIVNKLLTAEKAEIVKPYLKFEE